MRFLRSDRPRILCSRSCNCNYGFDSDDTGGSRRLVPATARVGTSTASATRVLIFNRARSPPKQDEITGASGLLALALAVATGNQQQGRASWGGHLGGAWSAAGGRDKARARGARAREGNAGKWGERVAFRRAPPVGTPAQVARTGVTADHEPATGAGAALSPGRGEI